MNEGNPARDAWAAATELLRAEGALSDSQTAFVRMAHPLATVDDIFMIAVGSEFVKTWIEEHVAAPMTSKLIAILGRDLRLVISVDPSITEMSATAAQPSSPAPHQAPASSPAQQTVVPKAPHHLPLEHPASGNEPEAPAFTPNFAAPPANFTHDSSFDNNEPRETYVDYYENQLTPDIHDFGADEGSLNPSGPSAQELEELATNARLNPRYTFDNFVMGESNRIARAASLIVAEAPGTAYNPLFFYSDSGMGKTHLMHAIGNYALRLYPHIKVRYISAEEFTNAFINAIRDGKQAEFKDQYRGVDILLIDDIQFIGGRTTIMEEFFHTFNALTNANKQIVITSDVAPNLLNGFEERMLSRFNSGLSANIDRPNLETRIAILEKKAGADGIDVPRAVHEYIASHMTTNIREMEGALRRVTAFADLSNQPVDSTLAEMVLKDLITNPDSVEVTASLIMGQAADYFEISIDDLKSPDRSRAVATARQIAMYLCREMTDLSLPKVGEIFGGRDHTTVLHACKKIDKQMSEKQTTYNQVSELTSRIRQAAQHREG
ncbi:chromosomal replication initiator protein DnaA [Arcanobacterium haemolyticum]|nr:chromosomal replication initiator protein DnaA [Arcanobacterium haemolyticum]